MNKLVFELERGENCVAIINGALDGMRISSLEIENDDGYLCRRNEYKDGVLCDVSYSYGFDRLELVFECDEDEGLMRYQIDAVALSKGTFNSDRAYHDSWCSAHPDCVMRVLQHVSYDDADAFIVLYHERQD